METAPSVPQWHSRPPGGSLRPQRPPRRLPPPELRSFAARRGSGWGGRDPVSVIRRTCSPSELSVASFVRDNAGCRLTSDPALPAGPEAARDTGLGRGRAVLSPEACAPARSKAPAAGLGRCRAPAPPCFLAPVSTCPHRAGAPRPVQTPHVWGEEGAAPGPRDNPARRLPPGHPLRGADVVAKFAVRVNYGGEFLFLFTSTGNQKGCLTREKVM